MGEGNWGSGNNRSWWIVEFEMESVWCDDSCLGFAFLIHDSLFANEDLISKWSRDFPSNEVFLMIQMQEIAVTVVAREEL